MPPFQEVIPKIRVHIQQNIILQIKIMVIVYDNSYKTELIFLQTQLYEMKANNEIIFGLIPY